MRHRLIAAVLLDAVLIGAALTACTSDSLAPPEYEGDPIAVLELFDREGLIIGDDTIAIGVYWLADRELPIDVDRLAPHPDRPRGPIDGALFPMAFYSPPPERALLDYGTGAPVAIGFAVAWHDVDGDRERDVGEPPMLTNAYNPFFYTPTALTAEQSPTGFAMPAGFDFVNLPLPCGPPPETTPGDCGVPLGALCETDDDCGPGVCAAIGSGVLESLRCVVEEPPADGCRPGDGILDYFGRPQDGVEGHYLPFCASDDDCPEAQICSPGGRFCGGPVPYLSDQLTPLRACVTDPLPMTRPRRPRGR